MENEKGLWTNAQANKFFKKQLKKFLKPYGFQNYPKGSRYFIRVKSHYVQAVYQESCFGGVTCLQMIVAPAFTYQRAWFFCGQRHILRCGRSVEDDGYWNGYWRKLAVQVQVGINKRNFYNPDDLIALWDNVTNVQLKEEIMDYFEQFDFEKYQILCEKRDDGVLTNGSNHDSPYFYAVGYNSIWQKNYDKAEEYLAKGIRNAEDVIQNRETPDETDPDGTKYKMDPEFYKDLYSAKEIMSILQKKEEGWENLLEEKLRFLEKDALETVWGIVLDDCQ